MPSKIALIVIASAAAVTLASAPSSPCGSVERDRRHHEPR